MKKIPIAISLFSFLVLFHIWALGQQTKLDDLFRNEIKVALNKNYTIEEEDKFAYTIGCITYGEQYAKIINSKGADSIRLDKQTKENVMKIKRETIYRDNIQALVNGSSTQKMLSYQLIYCFHDSAYYDTLWQRFERLDEDEGIIMTCLAGIFPNETDRIFNTISKHETWGDAVLSQVFVRIMDTASLISAFYKHLDDTDKMIAFFSLQSLSVLDSTAKADTAIITALSKYSRYDKGFAITALQGRKHIYLKPLLMPYVNNSQLHKTIVETLYMSGYKDDVDYAKQIGTKRELKDCEYSKELRDRDEKK